MEKKRKHSHEEMKKKAQELKSHSDYMHSFGSLVKGFLLSIIKKPNH
ncbi:MAG: hypothetical protein ACM3S2_09350 [Ignavibacteriales bacterium]